jgi:hypothetical protein
MREIFPKFIEDTPKYQDLARIRDYLEQAQPGWAEI